MNSSLTPIEWILENLEPAARMFHVGQYCGEWKASAQGFARASFHWITAGQCWLHSTTAPSRALYQGDAVFIFQDHEHWLSSTSRVEQLERTTTGGMQPFGTADSDTVGLVCGFFDFSGGLDEWVIQSLPACLVLRADDEGMPQASSIFRLIQEETQRQPAPSHTILQHLSDLLLIYTLRTRLSDIGQLGGLLGLLGSAQFRPLFNQLIEAPAKEWTLDSMAAVTGLSRSAFFKHFSEHAGQSPGQVVLTLRMHHARKLLQQDHSVAEVAEAIGYQSIAAFTRAFKKYSGQSPGVFRRTKK